MKNRLPSWLKQEIPDSVVKSLAGLIRRSGAHTVCQEARCPNIASCFKNKALTFMLLGNICTRNCRFCAVPKFKNKSPAFDEDEPYKVSMLVKKLRLRYVVITSVARDDLIDGGAAVFAKTIELIRRTGKDIKVEALIPDFQGSILSLKRVLEARPFITAHNLETVRRLYNGLRPQADYKVSLELLNKIKIIDHRAITKSSLMLGLGEEEGEVEETMKDLRTNKCDILTLGQYLAPSANHYPVRAFIKPAQFKKYQDTALNLGFKAVFSGPNVRSSYQAEKTQESLSYV